MALSRRLFIGGLLASAAAPAIITSKGFKPAVQRGYVGSFYHVDESAWYISFDTEASISTGRMSCSEPAWQDFRSIERNLHPQQREVIKQLTFGERYGTTGQWRPGSFEQAEARAKRPLINLDFGDMEARMIAQRDLRDMFNDLKRG
jgi:hypothetical protein